MFTEETDFVSIYTYLIYFGILAIYWTPIAQEKLDIRNTGVNILVYLLQGIPFLGNAVFAARIAQKELKIEKQLSEVEDKEDTVEEKDEEDDNTEGDKLDTEILDREDFEDLELHPKNKSRYKISWLGIILTIFTLNLWVLAVSHWRKNDVDELVENADKTLSEQGLENKNYTLCSNKDSNLIAIPHEKSLLLFKIDSEKKDIEPYKNIDFEEIKQEEKNTTYAIYHRDTGVQNEKLYFKDSEHRKKFLTDKLQEELNNHDLYCYNQVWEEKETVEEMKRADIGLKSNFRNLTPYEFEYFIAELFKKKGYDAYVTDGSGDFGVDVIAEKNGERLAIQVKRYKESNKIGSPTIRKTLGSRYKADADKTLIVTTSYYTQPAFEQAEDAPIILWDKKVLHDEVEKNFINLD